MFFILKRTAQTIALSLTATFALASCTSQSANKECISYEEAKLPVEVTSDWSIVPSGIQASIGSIDKRYIQHEVPEITKSINWIASAWKGERTSAQIILC